MSHRTGALSLVLGALLVLSVPAATIGTAGAQEAGNDGPTPVLDAPDTIERGQLYHLDGSDSTGDIEEYRWDYNPNAPTEYQRGTERDAIYAEDRTDEDRDQFTVRLGVVDGEGNVEWTSETINVTEAEGPEASIASSDDFTVEREQTEKRPSWFNSTSTDNQGIRSCEWTFEFGPTVERHSGDGLGWGPGSTECNKNFAFPVPGTYNVTLTVEDWAGNTDTTTRKVEVVPKYEVTDDPQPEARLSAPDRIEWGSTYWMNASNSTSEDDIQYFIRESNPDNWNSDEENLGHDTYYGALYDGQFDTIDVAVGIRTVNDQTDWAWETIEIIEPEKPDAAVDGPDAVATGDWGTFDASNSSDNDRIRGYDWTITDTETGETVHTGSGVDESYQFDEPGTYDVTVRVGDWVNHSRDGPYHYGVATKTVTVTEDGEPVNEGPTVAASADPQTVTAGDETTLTADADDGDGSIQSVEWDLGDGDTATGETVTHAYDNAGTYTATVTVTDDDGATASDSVDVTVESASDDGDAGESGAGDGDTDDSDSSDGSDTDDSDSSDDSNTDSSDPSDSNDSSDDTDSPEDDTDDTDDSSSPSGSTGGSAGGAPPADSGESDDATVEVEHVNESTDLVDVADAPDDETVTIDLGASTSDGAVGYQQLDVRATGNDTFSLAVRAHDGAPTSASADDVEGFDALSSLTVDGAETDDLTDATVEFRVSKERLDETGADAGDVALRRHADGGSGAVDAEQINETDDAYVYRAEAGAVTTYAVGVERPSMRVTDLAVGDGEHTAGDTVEVTATVANTGQSDGTMDVSLTVDGEVYDERSVDVDARDSATATFSVPVEDAEEHTLRAGDASTTMTVASQETATEAGDAATDSATEATTTTDDGTTPGTAFGGVSGFGALAALLAIAVAGAAMLVYRR